MTVEPLIKIARFLQANGKASELPLHTLSQIFWKKVRKEFPSYVMALKNKFKENVDDTIVYFREAATDKERTGRELTKQEIERLMDMAIWQSAIKPIDDFRKKHRK